MPLTNFKTDLTSYLKKIAGVHAIGELWWHYDPKSKPAGVQLFSGQLLSREAYPDHWTLVSTKRTVVTEEEWQAMVATQGFCQFYSSGDGSTTYRMPLIKDVHPKFVAALAEVGQHIKAGAPNITGDHYEKSTKDFEVTTSGAFYKRGTDTYGYTAHVSETQQYPIVAFDASRSSSVYRDDIDTVQPEALTMVVGEWVVGVAMPVGTSDAESLLASVTTLESNVGELASGSGFSSAGKNEIIGWGMPSSRIVSIPLGASLSTYTAPANGYFCANAISSASNTVAHAIALYHGNSIYSGKVKNISTSGNSINQQLSTILPVKKGDNCSLFYTNVVFSYGTYDNLGLYFVYAEGEED